MRYPLPKYDQVWVPDFNAGAMENFGCVTHAERTTSSARRSPTSSTSSGPTRSCTRWPTCGSATWSPCAGGTTCGSTSRSPSGPRTGATPTRPGSPTPGPRSCRSARTGATARTSSPPPTRSTARCPTSRRSRSTSTASRTPRAPAVIKQLVAYVGLEPFLAGLRAYFAAARLGQRHLRRPARRAGGGVRPRAARVRRPVAGDRAGQHAAPGGVDRRRTARTSRSRCCQEAPADYPTLRTHRIGIGLYDLGRRAQLVRRERLELDVDRRAHRGARR